MRALHELIVTTDPAWPRVAQGIHDAKNHVEVLAADDVRRRESLLRLQITTRSPMGAIVFETGGLLVDHGWLRVLGSGHPRLPRSLPDWNAGRTWIDQGAAPPLLLVADDVVGGFFAINGGGLAGRAGSVQYFAPDTLNWQDLELSYSAFLSFALSGDLERFYEASRWEGWREEIDGLPGDQGLSVYPFLWAEGPPVAERSRRRVPIAELGAVQLQMATQMRSAR